MPRGKFRLRARPDIEKVLKRGKIFKTEHFMMRFLPNGGDASRAGFVVSSSAAKKAVRRNLLRRRGREIVRGKIKNLRKGYDLIFIFSKSAPALTFPELKESMERALAGAGML